MDLKMSLSCAPFKAVIRWFSLQEAQQSSLLDMEMADYERLVKELNTKLSEKDECVEELKGQINSLNLKEEVLKQEIGMITSSGLHSVTGTQNNTIQMYLMLHRIIEILLGESKTSVLFMFYISSTHLLSLTWNIYYFCIALCICVPVHGISRIII